MEKQQKLEETAREMEARGLPHVEDTRRHLRELNERIITFIRERPGTSLIGALAVGYVVGRIARR